MEFVYEKSSFLSVISSQMKCRSQSGFLFGETARLRRQRGKAQTKDHYASAKPLPRLVGIRRMR